MLDHIVFSSALALAEPRAADAGAIDAVGYPAGHFGAAAGSCTSEPLEAPEEPEGSPCRANKVLVYSHSLAAAECAVA